MVTTIDTPPDSIDPQSPAARRAGLYGWWFYVVVIVAAPFALILAAVAGVYLWWKLAETKAAHDVELEVARIQALGEPVSIHDLYTYHRVPEGTKDITAQWMNALRLCNSVSPGAEFDSLPIVGRNPDHTSLAADAPDSQLAKAEEFLQLNGPGIQAALAVARVEGECRFPKPFEMGVAAPAAMIQQSRGLARLMSLRVRVSVERNNTAAALDSIETTLALTRAIEHELTLVEQLVRIAILGVAMKDIQFVLENAELSDEQLAQLQDWVQAIDIQNSFTTSLLGERGVGFHSFHQFAALPLPPAVATAADPMAGGRLTRASACKYHLQAMQEMIDASRLPSPQSMEFAKQLEARTVAAARSGNPIERMNAALTAQFLPASQAAFQARARIEAWRNLTLTAIAARRYRLAHGEYPSDMQALVGEYLPSVPIDSHDGQPLRMIRERDDLVLYSVGRDGIDNGGQDPQDRGEPDIVVRLKSTPSPARP